MRLKKGMAVFSVKYNYGYQNIYFILKSEKKEPGFSVAMAKYMSLRNTNVYSISIGSDETNVQYSNYQKGLKAYHCVWGLK